MEKWIINQPIKEALTNQEPLVALESTIIAHGMPYPKNLETAKQVEQVIRKQGAIPATIGIIKGQIIVGLTEEQIHFLANTKPVIKASRRDLPMILAKGQHGATTVSGTMIAANLAGIKIFVTGGIGGVHRGAAQSFDISADLTELSQTSVAVVCAGVKSILDIGLTLEKLETLGVPVIGYQTQRFPAFYHSDSGYDCDAQVDSPEEMASILKIKWDLGLTGGVVIGNPIPKAHELDKTYMDQMIQTALQDAEKEGVKGKETTPYLLDKMKQLTQNTSLEANIALVMHNAKVGADIAIAYAKCQKNGCQP